MRCVPTACIFSTLRCLNCNVNRKNVQNGHKINVQELRMKRITRMKTECTE